MTEPKIRYYVVIKGNGYWRPTARMRAAGFQLVRCGPDGPSARATARVWADRWAAYRKGEGPPDLDPVTDRREAGYVYFMTTRERVKIGFSLQPLTRASQLATGMAEPIDSLVIVRGTRKDERRLHARFDAYRREREWFVISRPIRLSIMRAAAAGRVVHDGGSSPKPEQRYQPPQGHAGPAVSTGGENVS